MVLPFCWDSSAWAGDLGVCRFTAQGQLFQRIRNAHAACAGGRDPAGNGFAGGFRRRHSLLHRPGGARLRQSGGAKDVSRRACHVRGLRSSRPRKTGREAQGARRATCRSYDESFFQILKDYTLAGYFLSEIGATQALAYERVPGGFQGDLPLEPNQKAWAI